MSFGLWAGGRFPAKDLLPYIAAQVAGGIAAGFILLQIASGRPEFSIDPAAAGAFASNGFGALSPGGYSAAAAFLAEVVLTAFFLIVIMGSTHSKAPTGFAPVSYTHLDVYKRQRQHHARSDRAARCKNAAADLSLIHI